MLYIIIAVLALAVISQSIKVSVLNKKIQLDRSIYQSNYQSNLESVGYKLKKEQDIVLNLTKAELARVKKRIAKKRDKGLKVK